VLLGSEQEILVARDRQFQLLTNINFKRHALSAALSCRTTAAAAARLSTNTVYQSQQPNASAYRPVPASKITIDHLPIEWYLGNVCQFVDHELPSHVILVTNNGHSRKNRHKSLSHPS
jgi:hypothetical protein